eukprot:2787570-Rhodomonas_salina.1
MGQPRPPGFHAISSMLPTYADGATPSPLDLASPTVVVSLDAKNAFNVVSRTAVFDAITGVASRFYDDGYVRPGDRIPSPECMLGFLPYIETQYGRAAAPAGESLCSHDFKFPREGLGGKERTERRIGQRLQPSTGTSGSSGEKSWT